MLRFWRIGVALTALALAMFDVSFGHPEHLVWWAMVPLLWLFQLSPMLVALAVGSRTDSLELRWVMAVFSAAYAFFVAIGCYAIYADPDVTSGLALVAMPAFGWFGLPLAGIMAVVIIRLRGDYVVRPKG